MRKMVMRYPGDPPCEVQWMTGEEFKEVVRGGQPGFIQVNDNPPIFFDEVVCDLCNGEILDHEQCLLVRDSYLYCDSCAKGKTKYISEK